MYNFCFWQYQHITAQIYTQGIMPPHKRHKTSQKVSCLPWATTFCHPPKYFPKSPKLLSLIHSLSHTHTRTSLPSTHTRTSLSHTHTPEPPSHPHTHTTHTHTRTSLPSTHTHTHRPQNVPCQPWGSGRPAAPGRKPWGTLCGWRHHWSCRWAL